ncbi:spermidine/putrescine-binding periplasmic protein precursor potD (SPBP) [Legionella birminghamensis]|uniref:Putrescine-binding periplasmic protein n=1 Tax=Legionella birminghamensis TaxID=28083 RepID=A0A378IJE1_9GAMM|nr:spermidine/putrescine ABC transporter substrate-binding protein [Legionella birminghamensis]KTC76102.1 spermidine/putrescine-binding periplasmic protein precursor potD (SPBP) [Legionella birminghamensis]STX32274.1 spermidine/putrescine-binding periplasmic protein precursor potD (SPBP) [Legionella birminghamensis]
MKKLIIAFGLCFYSMTACAAVVNVYVWGGEIPKTVVQQFENETGIKVNFSTYDSNETMYAKLKASSNTIYDVILPSGYFVERMKKQNMLHPIDPQKLPNLKNLDPVFTNNDYDRGNQFSVPMIWGLTGIFYNAGTIKSPPDSWAKLWEKQWQKQLMLLDDSREVFAIALMSLGFDPNDSDADHIRLAYEHLLKLVPNIKLFASDSIQAIMIDEDASLGTAWNGDAFKAQSENKAIQFIFPKDGFVIWVDCLAMPLNPPHPEEAYAFINFILRPDISSQIALKEGHAITNLAGRKLLPQSLQQNTLIYPPADILQRGHFQRDVGEETLLIYNQYWEQLKLAF